ncbi:hypothetical protein MRS44_018333 [Fusarium solani]|uniref:uncharacterized protein n=1 Tax=Fusarium solani TaxID=169388 RepID=UPI0032C4AEB0|nr:hypothetical protein MRS44_018333 [Fusarium solani]
MAHHPVNEMIDLVWDPPRGVQRQHRSRKHPDNFQYYCQWGFTIYRTYYDPQSDKYWNMLLGALKQQTRLAFGYYEDEEDVEEEVDQGDVQRLKELFHLNPREDASLLDGLDVHGIRALCKNEESDDKRAMGDKVYDFVLLADESVLKDIARGEFIVKAISLEWCEGFPGWGWMRIPTGYLLQLWQKLMRLAYNTELVLSFNGPEQDLEDYVWPGDLSVDPTGVCSEVRRLSFHYSGQRPDRTN